MYKHTIISNQIATNFATNERKSVFLDENPRK